MLCDSLHKLVNTEKKLGVLGTHAGIAESIAAAAINSARSSPITGVDDIGGLFDREDNALLVLDYDPEDIVRLSSVVSSPILYQSQQLISF